MIALTSVLVSALAGAGAVQPVPPGQGFYRQPAIHRDTVVFVAEGDLWRVPTSGGAATRLTSHAGEELHPAISPDGTTVAFLASYEGPTEVYTMPLAGGLPVRRSFGALDVRYVGWTPNGRVVYSTEEFSTLPSTQLVVVDLGTGTRERIPLAEADQAAFTPDSGTLIFTRHPFQGSHTKRYKGGFVQQLWRYDNGAEEAVALTVNYDGTSKDPVILGGRIFFASDRDGIMNIWSSDLNGADLRQHTRLAEFDINTPDGSDGRIVYQHGADIWLLDTRTDAGAAIPITLTSDFDQMREQWVQNPARFISSVGVSPSGDKVVVTARGKVFVAPVKQGRLVEVTFKDGERYRNAGFLPDGKTLFALSDRSGEVEFWTLPANGVGEFTQLTTDGVMLRWSGVPSPDGTLLAHTDKAQKLYLTDIAAKTTRVIAESAIDMIREVSWAPDSRWLVFTQSAENTAARVMLYSVESGVTTPITSDRNDSFSAQFSPDGKWLYFLSDRHFRTVTTSPWGPLAPQPFFDKRTKIYHVALESGTRSPWQPDDELMPPKDKKDEKKEDKADKKNDPKEPRPNEPGKEQPSPDAAAEKKSETDASGAKDDEEAKKNEKPKPPPVKIDLDGIQTRLLEVPIEPGNYGGLVLTEKALFFGSTDAAFEPKTNLQGVAIGNDKIEVKTVASDVRSYALSADGKKLLLRKGDNVHVVDAAPAPAELDKGKVDLGALALTLTPRDEWAQMYVDAWRLLRDYFYAPNLHGVDWPKMRDKYRPLVERVRSRADLNDILAQLSGELSALHHFVVGGDQRRGQDRVGIASLGAEWTRDEPAGGYRVTRVVAHDPDQPEKTAPLARPGVGVKAGDVITHINGVATLSVPDPMMLLRNQAERQVLLRVTPVAPGGAAPEPRDVVVVPIAAGEAADRRYHEWEHQRRMLVEEWGAGDIGYVHLRAMGENDIAQWARHYYPVFNRKGLIIDVRRNGGGNIDSWILGQLLRRAWMYWNQRVGASPAWNMQYAFRGHLVVICDAYTASDGEAFSEGFKRLGLGKVIGTRTWGGEIWLSFDNRLSDNGIASAGEFGVFGPEGAWLVEGRGVDPDIVVDNPPHATFGGQDAQLRAAVDHLQQLIRANPVEPPTVPPLPDKSFRRAP